MIYEIDNEVINVSHISILKHNKYGNDPFIGITLISGEYHSYKCDNVEEQMQIFNELKLYMEDV